MPPSLPEDKAAFLATIAVSRETLARLERYAALLADRNQNLSLIADSTLPAIWTRHFLDSAQIAPLIPNPEKTVVDLGTGAGFPGLVLAILGMPRIHLVENNMQKVAFLRTVIAELDLSVTVHAMKVETVPAFAAGAVTARALKPLTALLALARKFIGPDTVCVFPKGRRAAEEIAIAARDWHFETERFPSKTAAEATVIRLSRIREAHA
jgi:16S rRNA (guanine527-N7)-methyltransferase